MEPTTIGKTRHDRGDDPARSPPRRRARLSLEVSTWPQFNYPAGTDRPSSQTSEPKIFRGDEDGGPIRDARGNEVINDTHSFELTAGYAFSPRYSVNLTLPVLWQAGCLRPTVAGEGALREPGGPRGGRPCRGSRRRQ